MIASLPILVIFKPLAMSMMADCFHIETVIIKVLEHMYKHCEMRHNPYYYFSCCLTIRSISLKMDMIVAHSILSIRNNCSVILSMHYVRSVVECSTMKLVEQQA